MTGPSSGPTKDGASFGKLRKLSSSQEFDRVFSENQYRVSASELLILAVSNDLEYSRLGMVIGKKALNLAPHRNKLKRHLRETFRHSSLPPLDIVVLARPGINKKPLAEWRGLVNDSFARLQHRLG